VLSGLIGYVLGMAMAMLAIHVAQDTKLTISMTPQLAGGLFAVTIGMCIFAAISAIIKVIRIDPAVVFSR
jgi:putative ABC transport system permease protein